MGVVHVVDDVITISSRRVSSILDPVATIKYKLRMKEIGFNYDLL